MAGKFPPHGFIGIALIVSFWLLNWTLTGLRTHWAFFPLWLGYIFFVDALAVKRGRSSLVTRRPAGFVGLFLISAPIWWIFEFLNRWTNYWVYKPVESFTNFEYHAYCTLSFSTVVPAVFVTAQCLASFRFFQVDHIRINVGSGLVSQLVCLALGSLMLAAVFLIPEISMAFLWISLFLILDPINLWVGNPSVLAGTSQGDWRLALIFMAAPLVCGFFWELWNYYSLPKWYYTVPYVDFAHIFEMPLIGYLGYLPFGLELFAMVALIQSLFGTKLLPFENLG